MNIQDVLMFIEAEADISDLVTVRAAIDAQISEYATKRLDSVRVNYKVALTSQEIEYIRSGQLQKAISSISQRLELCFDDAYDIVNDLRSKYNL